MITCQRPECRFIKHTNPANNGGTHCCRRCKDIGGHGPACQKKYTVIKNYITQKALFVFTGESFRLGGNGSRVIGDSNSVVDQINAANSHIHFLESVHKKYNIEINAHITTYETAYSDMLIKRYKKYLVSKTIISPDRRFGINGLFKQSLADINNINKYSFIFFIRIDLLLKEEFVTTFNPQWDTLKVPYLIQRKDKHLGENDTMLFIPNRLFDYIDKIHYGWSGHYLYRHLINTTDIKNTDLGVMLAIICDANSAKESNPLYIIVNRNVSSDINYFNNRHDKHTYDIPYPLKEGFCTCGCNKALFLRSKH